MHNRSAISVVLDVCKKYLSTQAAADHLINGAERIENKVTYGYDLLGKLRIKCLRSFEPAGPTQQDETSPLGHRKERYPRYFQPQTLSMTSN